MKLWGGGDQPSVVEAEELGRGQMKSSGGFLSFDAPLSRMS